MLKIFTRAVFVIIALFPLLYFMLRLVLQLFGVATPALNDDQISGLFLWAAVGTFATFIAAADNFFDI